MGQRQFFPRSITACLVAGLAGLLAACGGGEVEPSPEPVRTRDAPSAPRLILAPPTAVPGTSRIALQWRAEAAPLETVSVWWRPSDRQDFQQIASGLRGLSTQVPRGASWQLDFPSATVKVRGCDAAGVQCIDSNEQSLTDALLAGVVDLDPLEGQPSPYGSFQISRDGHTVAALRNTQMGMYGNPYESFIPAAVDVFHRAGEGRWRRTAHLPTPDISGVTSALALSGDGQTLAMPLVFSYGGSAPDEVPGGIVVFERDNAHQWAQRAILKVPESVGFVESALGHRLALSANGRRLVASGTQRLHVFERKEDGAWRHAAMMGPLAFGNRLALSGNGEVIAVPVFQPAAAGIPGHFTVQVFAHHCGCGSWSRRATLRSSAYPAALEQLAQDEFGMGGLALDHPGVTLAVGAPARSRVSEPGAVYIFGASQGIWAQKALLQQSGDAANDQFGLDLALGSEGRVLVGNACSRFVTEPGVHRNFREGALPLGQGECHPQAHPAYSHGAYVYRVDEHGVWQRAAALVPNQVAPRFPGDALRLGERLVPVLSGDAQTLAIGVYIDREPRDGTSTSGLKVY